MNIAGKYTVPDTCPNDCPERGRPFDQGSLCFRCPLLNCVGEEPMLRPSDFREDWAKAWAEWFENGMIGLPELYL